MSDSGTIDYITPLMVFLGSMVSAPSLALAIELPVSSQHILRYAYGLRLRHPTLSARNLPRHIKVITLYSQFRNINLISIAYAFRPLLRID